MPGVASRASTSVSRRWSSMRCRVSTVTACGVCSCDRFSRVELLVDQVVYEPVPSVVEPGAFPLELTLPVPIMPFASTPPPGVPTIPNTLRACWTRSKVSECTHARTPPQNFVLRHQGDAMKLRPLHDRVIDKRLENETKTAS